MSITNVSLPTGLTGKLYKATITTTGGNGQLKFALVPGSFFPGGLVLNALNGEISGTVAGAVFGDVTFQVTDSGTPQQKAEKTLRMRFNWALSVTSNTIFPAAMHTSVAYSIPFYADSSNGNVSWSVANGQLPAGMSLSGTNSTQATVSGTPTQTGSYAFTVQVVDSSSPPQTATKNATINVDNKLAIATVDLPAPYSGDNYSQTLTAVNGTPPYQWSAGQYFPSFFHLDANTGVLSASPAYGGNYTVDVSVTDSSTPAQSATQSYSMLILPRLQVNGATLADAHLDNSYSASMYHSGGQGSLNWTVVSGSLPPGITLQPAYGVLSGIPTQLGTYTFTAQVQDSSTPPQTAQGQFTINVLAALLQLQQSLPGRIPVNVPFDGAAVVTGGTQPVTWKLNAGTLPTGLTLDSGTGRISGTPTATGNYSFNIGATDSSNPQQTAQQQYYVTVGPALGRNDAVTNATPLGNGSFSASISPLVDPADGTTLNPDSDYYKITSIGGAIVKINVNAWGSGSYPGPMDPVLELVDANGARLSACRQPGDSTNNFTSTCLNDDIVQGTNRNSQLEYLVPGTPDQQVDVYAHVFDWRGDARPDMRYFIIVSGAYVPIVFNTIPTPPTAYVNTGYGFNTLSATGGSSYLNSSIVSGQLPPGLSLQGSTSISYSGGENTWYGYIYGTPTTAGDYTFSIQLTDTGQPAQTVTSQPITIHVKARATISSIPSQTLKVGDTTTVQAQASGGTPPYTWSISGWSGASIDSNTGLITVTATQTGTYYFTVSLVDAQGISANGVTANVTVTQ